MAKETAQNPTTTQPETQAGQAPKESFNIKKILMISVPIVLVQIVLIYFIFVKFIAPSVDQPKKSEENHQETSNAETEQTQVLVIKDIIVNPAGTNGTRFLLTTIGLEVPSPEIKTELEQKEVQTRDILISVLTSKGLEELNAPQFKEALRKEILEKINSVLKKGKIKNVYFSKFIIQ